jgi:hypothetical protein
VAREERIRLLYEAFNAREVSDLLAEMTPDVDWANGWEGGRIVGQDQVRAYWERQWTVLDPHVEPEEIVDRDDGAVEVVVHQLVKDTRGQVLADDRVRHVYWFRDDLIARMEIEEG